jgi:hypothetical protein
VRTFPGTSLTPLAILQAVHPRARATAIALAELDLGPDWWATARVCGGITLTHRPSRRAWTIAPLGDRTDAWTCVPVDDDSPARRLLEYPTAAAAVASVRRHYQPHLFQPTATRRTA